MQEHPLIKADPNFDYNSLHGLQLICGKKHYITHENVVTTDFMLYYSTMQLRKLQITI